MASSWQPIHRAAKMLEVDRKDLYRMRDSGDLKLGKHYGAGPMTRSRDSYYWNIPRMKKLLAQAAKPEQEVSSIVLSNHLAVA